MQLSFVLFGGGDLGAGGVREEVDLSSTRFRSGAQLRPAS